MINIGTWLSYSSWWTFANVIFDAMVQNSIDTEKYVFIFVLLFLKMHFVAQAAHKVIILTMTICGKEIEPTQTKIPFHPMSTERAVIQPHRKDSNRRDEEIWMDNILIYLCLCIYASVPCPKWHLKIKISQMITQWSRVAQFRPLPADISIYRRHCSMCSFRCI